MQTYTNPEFINRQPTPAFTEGPYKKDYYENLPSEVKSRLGDLLLTYCEEELRVEAKRLKLCQQHDFEPFAAFTRIDRLGRGIITGQDLSLYLASAGI